MIKSGWYICPYCNKRLFPVQNDTVVKNLPQKCRACKHIFLVQINNKAKESEMNKK